MYDHESISIPLFREEYDSVILSLIMSGHSRKAEPYQPRTGRHGRYYSGALISGLFN
jgi:hypothetical protein